jgi:hypothetical protein
LLFAPIDLDENRYIWKKQLGFILLPLKNYPSISGMYKEQKKLSGNASIL